LKIKYTYAWGNNSKRATLKGRELIIIACLKMNSVIVRFDNGQEEVVSRRALRKVKGD